MTISTQPARIYNQVHVPRKSTAGRRRFSIYITWSYPAEANKDLTQLDNRFSSMPKPLPIMNRRTTKLYDRTREELTVDEIGRIR